jgi:hypothetical protein
MAASEGTEASPPAPRVPRVGGMATMPTRRQTLRKVLEAVLPQLDRLYIYLDKHEAVPTDLAAEPKIVPLLPSANGMLGGGGKFLGLELHAEPCFYFSLDDDILYPANYVEVLVRALERHRRRAAVGFHAAWFKPPHQSYIRDRVRLHFSRALSFDCHADEIGTGTMALYSGNFRFDPRAWRDHGMTDLNAAIEAVKQEIPRIAIRRPQDLLRPIEENQDDSIYARLARDDSRETAIMREALAAYPGSWQLWE